MHARTHTHTRARVRKKSFNDPIYPKVVCLMVCLLVFYEFSLFKFVGPDNRLNITSLNRFANTDSLNENDGKMTLFYFSVHFKRVCKRL